MISIQSNNNYVENKIKNDSKDYQSPSEGWYTMHIHKH